MMQHGGIGGLLSLVDKRCGQHLIAAIVFTSRAAAPVDYDGRPHDKEWMRWGTQLALHSDATEEMWQRWMGDQRDSDDEIPQWLSAQQMQQQTRDRLRREHRARSDALHLAEIVREERDMARQAGKICNDKARIIMRRATDEVIEAQHRVWKDLTGTLMARIANGVLFEFREDERCPDCSGTGVMPYVRDDRLREVPCPRCFGTGLTRYSERERADLLGVSRGVYARAVKPAYHWMWQEAYTARRDAVRHLRDQLAEP
jgi:hypothetical protein